MAISIYRSFLGRAAAIALAFSAASSLASAASAPTIVTPSAVAWTPGTGDDAGSMVAVLDGNPTKAGPYTIRIKLPAGARYAPHMHAAIENVTVISGTILVGLGDTMNVATMKPLPAGSFASIPAGLHHYAMAKGATVLQISGIGPDKTTMLGAKK